MKLTTVSVVPMLSTAVLAAFAAVARAQAPATRPAAGPAAGSAQSAQSATPSVDPVADRVLRESCAFLAQTKAFSVHAEIWKDEVLPSGHKIQVTRTEELELRRPDRLHVEQHAHHKGRSVWYDGKTVTVMDRERNTYGTADAPGTIDETLDVLGERYGITVPLEDLAVTDPYASAMKNVNAGGYFGDEPVLGVRCRHIAFSTDRIDWQLWVADGAQPLPQKLVITYKTEEQSPQYTVIFSKWALTGRASDLAFEFVPPRDSERVPLVEQGKQDGNYGGKDGGKVDGKDGGQEKSQANHETNHQADKSDKSDK